MSAGDKVDPSTGQRRLRSWLAPAIIGLVLVVIGGTAFYLTRSGPKKVRYQNAGGSLNPTIAEVQTGKPPEDAKKDRELEAFNKSLGLDPQERERRKTAAEAARGEKTGGRADPALSIGEPEPISVSDSDREVRPLSGVGNIMADVERAEMGRLTGGGQTVAPGKAPVTPYLSLHSRRVLAAQREIVRSGAAGTDKAVNTLEGKTPESPNMESYKLPTFVEQGTSGDATSGGEKIEDDAHRSGANKISVNVLPPHTLEIPAIFMQNFIAFGSGSDTGQRVVAFVESDVVHRNRVQLPRGAMFIGTTGGVRNLDMVDVKFDLLQFPDGTQVPVSAQAYSAYSPEYPDNFGMRGVPGEYEAPPAYAKIAPIILSAVQGYTKSNFDRLAGGGVRISSDATLSTSTSDRDRVYGAASQVSDKLVAMVMEDLARYQPRVRVRLGSPLIIKLDQYVDLSQRAFNGAADPFKTPAKSGLAGELQTPGAKTAVVPGAGSISPFRSDGVPDLGDKIDSSQTTTPETGVGNMTATQVREALKRLSPDELKKLVDQTRSATNSSR